MKTSEIYGYNFPLNWDDIIGKIKDGLIKQIEYEIDTYEPYGNDIEMLWKSDNIEASQVWKEIEKWIAQWVDDHIELV